MQLRDLTVEVRNRNLQRVGQILPDDLNMTWTDLFNNVGQWEIKLPSEHPMTPHLRQPGAGAILFGPGSFTSSGPMTEWKQDRSPDDTKGTYTFKGVTDNIHLADRLAWPVPSNDTVAGQTASHDVRTGKAETLMHQYVNANMGPGAPASRRLARFRLGEDYARGPSVKKQARFPILGTLLSELAVLGSLGFRIVHLDEELVFLTYAVTDQSANIRLDIDNGTLSGYALGMAAPGATHVMVAGQGEGVDRAFLLGTNTEATEAATAWGRRIERFVDQRQTDDEDEYQQKVDEILAEQGNTQTAVQVVPSDDNDSLMRFGRHWNIGHLVTVVSEQTEIKAVVNGYTIKAGPDGFRLGALIGQFGGRIAEPIEVRIARLEAAS